MAQTERTKRTWKTWQLVAASTLAFFLGIGAGASSSEKDQEVSATGQADTTTQATVATTTAATDPPTTPPPTQATTTTAPGPKTEFGNGTHRVGVDIAPGTYVAPGGTACYWERQSVFGGSGSDAIIANDLSRGGQAVVTIAASDKGFKTSGCGTWKRG